MTATNNPKLNNLYHYLLMFAVVYFIGYKCKSENYTFDGRYIGFPIAMLIVTTVFGGFLEYLQATIMKVDFDRVDVLRYAIGGASGVVAYTFFPAQVWIVYASSIPAAIACVLTLAHYWKVKKNQ
jgi:hypothetical protein